MFGNFDLLNVAPFLVVFVIFYFLILRPQTKKVKAHKEMLDNLKKGQEVIMGSGLIGKIAKVSEQNKEIELEIASGVIIRCLKQGISQVRS